MRTLLGLACLVAALAAARADQQTATPAPNPATPVQAIPAPGSVQTVPMPGSVQTIPAPGLSQPGSVQPVQPGVVGSGVVGTSAVVNQSSGTFAPSPGQPTIFQTRPP